MMIYILMMGCHYVSNPSSYKSSNAKGGVKPPFLGVNPERIAINTLTAPLIIACVPEYFDKYSVVNPFY